MGVKVREKIMGSGVWWVFINRQGERTSSMIGSEKAAEEVKETVEAQLKLGQYVFPKYEKPVERQQPTVQEYFEKLKETYYQTSVRESTADKYETNFRVHILPSLGGLRLDEVTREHMENLVGRPGHEEATGEGHDRDGCPDAQRTLHACDGQRNRSQANPATRLGEAL